MDFLKGRFKKTQNIDAVIGLDLSSSMIKWVSLGADRALEHYAIQTISTSMGITRAEEITQIAIRLKETLFDQPLIKECVVNIPDVLVCSKWVQLDYADCQRIDEIVELLAAQFIPLPLDRLYFDYQVFEPVSKKQEKCKVLLVACRKKDLDFRLDLIQRADLVPVAVEVSSHALERAYSFFYPDSRNEGTLLLDVGANQLSLLFLNDDQAIVYCEHLFNILEKESILLQIKRVIKTYVFSRPYCILSQIFLVGDKQSLLAYLSSKLDGFLGLKIQILKYQNKIKCSSRLNTEISEKIFLNLFLSYGLALRPSDQF